MSEQEQIQKQSVATELSQSEHSRFATRGFAEQIGQDIASQPTQDIKTQLSRAERFGHNLSKMPVPTNPSPVAALQTKVSGSGGGSQAIQRAEIEEDDELQMKSEPGRDAGFGSILDGIRSIDDPTMDLNAYKSLNQHVESLLPQLQQQSLLPQLQQQMMQQQTSGSPQNANAVQFAKGGGGGKGKGGMMSKLNPMSKIFGK